MEAIIKPRLNPETNAYYNMQCNSLVGLKWVHEFQKELLSRDHNIPTKTGMMSVCICMCVYDILFKFNIKRLEATSFCCGK